MSEHINNLKRTAQSPEILGVIRIKELGKLVMKEMVLGLENESDALLRFEELSERPEGVYEIKVVKESGVQDSIEDTQDLNESASLKAISVCAGYVIGTQLQKQFRKTINRNPEMSYNQMIQTLPNKFSLIVKRGFEVYKEANPDEKGSDVDILADEILHTALKFYSVEFVIKLMQAHRLASK